MADRPSQHGVVVIGLGRFGGAVAESLVRLGHDVLGIDENADVTQSWSDRLTHVVQADTTNTDVLRRLGVPGFGCAVVGIGTDMEASVLTVLALADLGIPEIWAKASGPRHGRILERTGAHHVIYPEADMGERVAHMVAGHMIDYIEFDDGFAIAKMRAPQEAIGKTLGECALRARHGITVVGVKPPRETFLPAQPSTPITPDSILIVFGTTKQVEAFAALA